MEYFPVSKPVRPHTVFKQYFSSPRDNFALKKFDIKTKKGEVNDTFSAKFFDSSHSLV